MNNIRKKYQQKNQAISEMVGRVDKELDLGECIQKMGDKTDTIKKILKSLQEETEKCIMQTDDKLADKYFSSPKLERRSTIFEKQTKSLYDTMTTYGRDLDKFSSNRDDRLNGDSKNLGKCLMKFGNSIEQLTDQKIALENRIRQDFIDPLDQLLAKDFKEVSYHRKKLESRRLNYSYQ